MTGRSRRCGSAALTVTERRVGALASAGDSPCPHRPLPPCEEEQGAWDPYPFHSFEPSAGSASFRRVMMTLSWAPLSRMGAP